jgi:hypothetical protein
VYLVTNCCLCFWLCSSFLTTALWGLGKRAADAVAEYSVLVQDCGHAQAAPPVSNSVEEKGEDDGDALAVTTSSMPERGMLAKRTVSKLPVGIKLITA